MSFSQLVQATKACGSGGSRSRSCSGCRTSGCCTSGSSSGCSGPGKTCVISSGQLAQASIGDTYIVSNLSKSTNWLSKCVSVSYLYPLTWIAIRANATSVAHSTASPVESLWQRNCSIKPLSQLRATQLTPHCPYTATACAVCAATAATAPNTSPRLSIESLETKVYCNR